jgi:hypothetical protein
MERASFVSESVLAGCELAEVPGRLGDDIVEEPEDDATSGLAVDGDIKLVFIRRKIRIARSGYEKSGLFRSTRCWYVRRR